MRIISKLRDYYDSAMAYGQDQSVVFVRNAELLDDKLVPKAIMEKLSGSNWDIGNRKKKDVALSYARNTIVFCGKTYRSITIERTVTHPDGPAYGSTKDVKVIYSIEEYRAYHDQAGFEFRDTNSRWSWMRTHDSTISAFLGNQGSDELEEFCIKNRYVILTYGDMAILNPEGYDYEHKKKLIANGYLDKFQFYRMLDSFSAYQELDMFVSGTLPQSTAMPIQIEDKHRIAQHGFDKYSFRKAPSK